MFRKKPKPPEITIADFPALAEASDAVNDAWERFDASRKAFLESVRLSAPAMVGAYDAWRAAALEWVKIAEKFNLAERRRIVEVMRVADSEMRFFRSLCESVEEVWPTEVNSGS